VEAENRADYRGTKKGMTAVNAVLGNEIAAGRVRISEWIEAEPASMLATGHMVCYVHHGGANSYSKRPTLAFHKSSSHAG